MFCHATVCVYWPFQTNIAKLPKRNWTCLIIPTAGLLALRSVTSMSLDSRLLPCLSQTPIGYIQGTKHVNYFWIPQNAAG